MKLMVIILAIVFFVILFAVSLGAGEHDGDGY